MTDSNTTVHSEVTDGMAKDALRIDLILCLGATLLTALALIWMLICMAAYGKRTNKWNTSAASRPYIACYISVALSTPVSVVNILAFFVPQLEDVQPHCELLFDMYAVFISIFVFSVYLFLWYRQRAMYGNPIMGELFGKHANALSWTTLGLICTAAVGFLIGYTVPVSRSIEDGICIYDPGILRDNRTMMAWVRYRKYVIGVCYIAAQFILLSLFVYPIVKLKMSQSSDLHGNTSSSTDEVFISAVRRTGICTTISVVSEMLAFITRGQFPWGSPVSYSSTVHHFSVLVNSMCIVATFGITRKIFFVFCVADQDQTPRQSVDSSRRNTTSVIRAINAAAPLELVPATTVSQASEHSEGASIV